jgi:hypothetical protein
MSDENLTSLSVFASAFGVAAFAGLATLLRFAKKLSKLSVLSAMLNSGFMGLAISLLWYQNYSEAKNIYGLIGICVLAGLGGGTLTDVFMSLLTGAGIKVTITHERDADGTNQHSDGDDHESTRA